MTHDPSAKETFSDYLTLHLRAYSEPKTGARPPGEAAHRPSPSPWVLVFDCETTTTPDQRLRFGAYQLRYNGMLFERGVFFDEAGLELGELDLLKASMIEEAGRCEGEQLYVRTRAAFVEEVLFKRAYLVGAQIVGFNLGFDISRLAIRHMPARGSMRGGFSFELSPNRRWPKIAVKHLSAKASLIRFTGASLPGKANPERKRRPDRGYFVDVKTLAAAMTSASHSLASLCAFLRTPTQKRATDEHDAPLSQDYVRYALDDVQATWECFVALRQRVEALDLPGLELSLLYSEASLGKAYLRAMGIAPWRQVQPEFPKAVIGQIMSAYFGGRAEVHIRRSVREVIHCDFLSMYPTVCTLMGLWRFVIGQGVEMRNNTDAVRARLASLAPEDLQNPAAWRDLTTLVQIEACDVVLPVRAAYSGQGSTNIGVNRLTCAEPLWFTLADVLASKMLTGKSPRVLQAITFTPGPPQAGLRPVMVAGQRLNPLEGDFYRSLIDQRSAIKARAKDKGADQGEVQAQQQAIKILANSTSYGIFMELNVERSSKPVAMAGFGACGRAVPFKSMMVERPGQFFHPLLGALITGAARLMLALAERQVIGQGLDWVFCDTDSIAIARPDGMDRATFQERAHAVQGWFDALNPYAVKGPLLKIEDVNYVRDETGCDQLEPLYCLAISAKRYVLFNRGAEGAVTIRKASGHGLGHLMDPFSDPPEVTSRWMKSVGAPRWQAALWERVIAATEGPSPDQVDLSGLAGFGEVARSRYAATTPALLAWFAAYNEDRPYAQQVKPFNFMLSLQVRSGLDAAAADPACLRGSGQTPRPIAPFTRDPVEAAQMAFDRITGAPVSPDALRSVARSLVRYHLHLEEKFEGDAGVLARRRVRAVGLRYIGKEAHDIEARQVLGEKAMGSSQIAFSITDGRLAHVEAECGRLGVSDRVLCTRAGLSHHTLAKLRRGEGKSVDFDRLLSAIEAIRKDREDQQRSDQALIKRAQAMATALGGVAALAATLGASRQYLGRVLKGERPMSDEVRMKLANLQSIPAASPSGVQDGEDPPAPR